MNKIIIHNYITDTSFAFTLAECAYREYKASLQSLNGQDMKFDFNGSQNVIACVHQNDKSVTITIREKENGNHNNK